MLRFGLHGYGEFDAECHIGPSCWPHFDLLFIHDGHVRLKVQGCGDDIELRSGGSLLLYPQTPFRGYSIVASTRASVMHFSLASSSATQRPPFARLLKLRNGVEINGEAAGKRAEADVHRAMTLARLPASDLLHELRSAVLMLVLAELQEGISSKASHAHDGRFARVMAWAQDHLECRPTVEDMATHSGLSTSHFRSLFQKEAGLSAGAYLKELRLREASRLLRETRTPMKLIAGFAGYTDVSTLYHAFRHRYKTSPAEYRRRHTLIG